MNYKFIICYFVCLSFIGGLFQPPGPCKVSLQCNGPMAKFEGPKIIAKKDAIVLLILLTKKKSDLM